MAWWNPGERKSETAKAALVGEELAKILDPEPYLQAVKEQHHLAANDLKPFLALASLSVAGTRIGLNQKSIVTRVDRAILSAIHDSFCAGLVWNYVSTQHPECSPAALVADLINLANKVTKEFYAHSQSKPPLPLPHWFACKATVAYLQNGEPASNPEEIM